MSRAGFGATAHVTSGGLPSEAVASYDVGVRDGRLRLAVHRSTGAVLDVEVGRVTVRPLGRGGTSIVEVDGAPLLVDFGRRTGEPVAGALGTARRVVPALRGRWTRRRFVAALRGDRP